MIKEHDYFKNDWLFGNEFEINSQNSILNDFSEDVPIKNESNASILQMDSFSSKLDNNVPEITLEEEENENSMIVIKQAIPNIYFVNENEKIISDESIKKAFSEKKNWDCSTKICSYKDEIEQVIKKNINFTCKNISNSGQSTNLFAKENSFKSHPRKYFRVDDAKKHFKVAISQYATETINTLIKDSGLPKKYKKKIHLPHHQKFSSNPKELDNYEFLSFTLKDVFTYGKIDGNLQARNEENISKILKCDKFPEKTKKIKDFLFLKYEDIIKQFYKSEKFDEFKKGELTQFFNEGIIKEKKISLLEENGLVKLFEMTKKKRKRELFSSISL